MNLRNYISEFINGTKDMFIGIFKKKQIKRNLANILSFQRIVIPIIAIITTLLSQPIITTLLVIFGGLTDLVDGKIARKLNINSTYGQLLDQITDKYYSCSIGIILSILNPIYIVVIVLEGAISAVNTFYKKKYPTINDKSSIIGKTKQFPLFISLCTGFLASINLTFSNINNFIITLAILMQTATLAHYSISKFNQAIKIDKNKDENENEIRNNSLAQQGINCKAPKSKTIAKTIAKNTGIKLKPREKIKKK